jgi:hypothetical protein
MEYINETYKVYVKTDADSIITAVNSSAFLSDTPGWVEIDEGAGDRYHHAQGHYLDEPLTDENGIFNYLLINGKPVLRSEEHKQPELDRINAAVREAEIKQELKNIDSERIRPLAAIAVGTATEYDTNKLAALEAQAAELRKQLAEM